MEVYVLPLSSAQKRLWYQEMIHPGNNAYNIPLGLRLQGDLDKQALEKVFQTIINRHEILRTRFAMEDGEPVQLVYPETNFCLECKVLESEDELIAESRKPFNLATDELIRANLYQVEPHEHILLVNMHHIISDGWSLGVFFREFSDLYSAYVNGSQVSLPELPIQYGDYAEWQETWLQEATVEKQLAYWQQQLVNLPPALDLPLEKSRPIQQSFQGATVREEIPSELIQGLQELAQREGSTFFMTALAVFQVLLFRYSGQSDIIVGSPIANRTQAELDNLIGFFVNTLALRGNLEGNPAFREFLLRIRQTCVDAYTHQDVPFEILVDKLDVKRDPSRSPIFQTLFAVQNAPLNDIQLPGLTINPLYFENGGSKFDLTLMLEPAAESWFATLEYNSDLFTSSAAQRILNHYCQLLRAVVANPGGYINSLPLLTQSERQELITLGNADLVSVEPKNIVELFIQKARTYPDRVAVKCQEKTLTYSELDKRSNRLAHFLQQQGVDAEVRVGIFQERSEELIVSILAVLKAGGTYVPLDPVYPQDRLSYIFADSGISLVVTQSDLVSSLPDTDKQIAVREEIEFTTDEPLTTKILPQQSAYIIYTSGSTGKPKGCVVAHGNVTRLMKSTEDWFGFNQNDVWTLFHSFAFDFSVWEIWGALLYGGKLVVVPYLESRSPEAFRQLLKDEGVTILNQTPSAFRQLIRVDGEMEDKLNLREVIFGGEALELQSLRPWFERYGDKSPRLVNMYGITETTVHVTYRPITLEDVEQNRGSVIGVPIPDLSLHILDEQLEPTPIGVPGEIYVGGMGVSKGYLNRPELTAQRFIPDLFNKTGAKLYRTGDVARRLSNGDIEYLGRCDRQVKVRGFRIELGEIESALVVLPKVAEAVVVTHSENAEDKRLVAYIVASDVERNDLRAALKEHLPDYMIPAAFVFMDAMPLTAQGKVNRKALPAPDWSLKTVERSLTSPQTPAQEVICQVWQAVLGIDKVGIEDNFFDLGGDSILALKVVSEMRRQGWILTPKDIFKQQTVTELATIAKQADSEIRTIEKVVGEAPLSPIQQWFFAQNLPNPHHWNQAVLLEVNQDADSKVFAQAVSTVAAHHDIFRLRFEQDAEIWRQFYAEEEPRFNFETVDLTLQNQEEQDIAMQAAMNRLQSELNINNGSLASAALFKLGERLPRLFVVVHHLIIDGVSWRILLEDLAGAISSIGAGETLQLSQPSSSFKQYSEFLKSWAVSPDIQPEKQFWLDNLPDTNALPLDFEITPAKNLESSLKTISRKFTQQETENLLTKANKPYHTLPQELLLAAVAKTISNITQNNNIQLTMEGHGREDLSSDLDITRTLGWFTTLYPLSLEVPNSQEKTLITSVKERVRHVSPHSLSYGLLRYLQPETEIPDNLPDISFNYLGQVRNETGDDKFFSLLNQDTGLAHDANGLRSHIIDIIAIVVEGELRVDWLYSSNLHSSETIDRWADDFQGNLQEILHHCKTPGVGEYTPSDFPLVNLNQSVISSLTTKYPDLEDIYPLSPLQSGMLFHTLYSPDDGVYFEQLTGKITGKLNISAFSTAWQTVVDRHPILRSAFVWEQEPPIQVVSKPVKFSVTEQDFRDLSPTQQQSQIQEYESADKKQGFKLDAAPLMRFTLIRLDDSTWQWVWSHHHLLLDGWSLPILFKEVLEIYQSATKGIPYHLDTVPPYRNYIEWLTTRDRQQAEEFWCEQLAGICEPTLISWKPPEIIDVGEVQSYEAIDLRLSDEEFAALQTMTQSNRITLNTLAQGAWALLLQKYGAGEDVLFGATVSGRPPEITDVENMVGLFINTLPMRVKLNPDVTAAAWLQEIQQHQVQMREYEYSKLTDIRQIAGFPSGEPMFESILVFENYPVNESLKNQGEDIQVNGIEFHERTNYPLTVAFVPDSGLLLKLNYETEFLSPPAAKLMLQRLRGLLLELAQKPEVSLGEVDILSAQERNLAIDEWNRDVEVRDVKFNVSTSILAHQLFEQQADLDPNGIALVFGEDAITYGELEQRANILAGILQSSGVTHESIVGLYFEPSTDFIVALLAVLKAGGAFLPLDTAYPQERLQLILEDSRASWVLTKEEINLNYEPSKIIALSKINWTNPTPRLNLQTSPDNLAYVIYTSGSTGKPKGVLVTHNGIQNLVSEQSATFGITKQSRVYQFASLNFDAAVSEIFMALGTGATLYLKPQAERFPGPALWSALTAWEISHVTIVPSLLATIKPEELPKLQTLIVAGEAASGSLLNRWSQAGCKVINAYGPTEATVCSSMKDCSDLVGEPSIGRAMANTEMYLLDKYFQPVVPGIPGELFISSIGLARGYLNRSDLTAAAFIPHPYSIQPGARLYSTGDMGIYDTKGNIHFLGRQDNRVKLHGYRIELGEIEAALTKHSAVDSAVVLLREDVPARPRLVAYALTSTTQFTDKDLLDYLSGVLPAYMVPSALVVVTEWSLTPNGKINRKALPAPEIPTHKSNSIPTNETEKILSQIWTEVLGLETVSTDDNFFEMGGDSIISLQIVSRAREAELEINPKDIFEAQTLGRLAAITFGRASLNAKSLTKKVEVIEPKTGKIPLSPIQQWFFERKLPHQHQWNQTVALSVKQPLQMDALLAALEAVVSHHDAFRFKYEKNQDIWEQSYAGEPQNPSLRIKDFSKYPIHKQAKALAEVIEEEQVFFNLGCPPLLRVLYVTNLAEHGDALILFAHHLVIDGVSWRILVEDLNQAYHQVIADKPVLLPGKTSSYRQWTTNLEKLANSSEIEQDIPFWQETTSNKVVLPLDNQASSESNTVESSAIETCQLSSTETTALLKSATANYHAGVQEILLVALLETIANWTESDNLLIDLEGHGRENIADELDLSRTVGWFTSLYPVLLQKPQNNDLENLFKQVKNQIRAIPHHGISFGLLRYLNQQQTLANQNHADISFNYLGQLDQQNNNNKLFNLSNIPVGSSMFAEQKRPHILAINARIQNETLIIDWCYSQNLHNAQTIRNLAQNYRDRLHNYLAQSTSDTANFYTSSDFNLVNLEESELDSILADLEA